MHGLWFTNDCSFFGFTPMVLTLSSDGTTLTGPLTGSTETVRFTRAAGPAGQVSARCSRVTARDLLIREHLGQPPEPAAQVLCGHFVGRRSNAMVVSLSTPSCGRSIGWLVFRYASGRWRTVVTRNNGADLTAVGSDIRESQFVLRPADSHCFPTGGTRSRIWHWNGHRFTHTAFRRTGAMFVSPTGNLWCVISISDVTCQSTSQPHTARLSSHGRLDRCSGPACFSMGSQPTDAAVLRYRHVIAVGAFRCQAEPAGVTCTLRRSGSGFLINRRGATRVHT
jgi:hypothetical protein